MKTGQRVRILIKAGVVERHGQQNRFIAAVEPGSFGIYVGPHKTLEDWHLVEVDAKG